MSDDAFRRYPYHFNIGSMSLDRIAAVQVPALKAQGYFSGWNTATGQPGPGKGTMTRPATMTTVPRMPTTVR